MQTWSNSTKNLESEEMDFYLYLFFMSYIKGTPVGLHLRFGCVVFLHNIRISKATIGNIAYHFNSRLVSQAKVSLASWIATLQCKSMKSCKFYIFACFRKFLVSLLRKWRIKKKLMFTNVHSELFQPSSNGHRLF